MTSSRRYVTGKKVFPKPSVLLKISAGTQFSRAKAVITMNDVVFTSRLNSILTVPQNCSHSAAAPKFPDLIDRQLNYPAFTYELMFGCTGGDFTHGRDLVTLHDGGESVSGAHARQSLHRSLGLLGIRRHGDLSHARGRFEPEHATFRVAAGKSGKAHAFRVSSARLARIVRQCEELPGQHLFEYVAPDGVVHPIRSHDVNAYIRDCCAGDFSAKDFRTLAGTVLAARLLRAQRRCEQDAQPFA